MKQFIVDRHTTPNTPTLEQVPTEKLPIYENRAAVEADLANLTAGQIVATADTGDELAQPVDVVEEGNLHAVTSNAVAESLSYSTTEQKTGGVWIDGKPIYRKVIEVNGIIPSGGISTGCPTGSLIISLNAIQVWNDSNWGNYYTTTNLQYTGSCNPAVLISSDGSTLVPSTGSTNKYTKCIIIEYVKPTN